MNKLAFDSLDHILSKDKSEITAYHAWSNRPSYAASRYIKEYRPNAKTRFEITPNGEATATLSEGTIKDVRRKLKNFKKGTDGTVAVSKPLKEWNTEIARSAIKYHSEKTPPKLKLLGLNIGGGKRVYPYRNKVEGLTKQELINLVSNKDMKKTAEIIVKRSPERASHIRKSTGEYVSFLSHNSRTDFSDYKPNPKRRKTKTVYDPETKKVRIEFIDKKASSGHEMIWYEKRSTPEVIPVGTKPKAKPSYGPITKRRKATADEEKEIATGKWIRIDERGNRPSSDSYKKTKYRPQLVKEKNAAFQPVQGTKSFFRRTGEILSGSAAKRHADDAKDLMISAGERRDQVLRSRLKLPRGVDPDPQYVKKWRGAMLDYGIQDLKKARKSFNLAAKEDLKTDAAWLGLAGVGSLGSYAAAKKLSRKNSSDK